MIRLRQTIERGMRHPVLGPLFVVLFVLLLAATALHAVHDGEHMATEIGDLCLGLVTMFTFLVVIRMTRRALIPLVRERHGRAPPTPLLLRPLQAAAAPAPTPLRL